MTDFHESPIFKRKPLRWCPLNATRRVDVAILTILVLSLCFVGCGSDSLNPIYGKNRGTSVNGTGVLAQMFSNSQHRVKRWRRLSPKLERSDVIVWVPDRFECPEDDEIEFLEEWLQNKGQRTLIYVGRYYDAEIGYWKKKYNRSGGQQRVEAKRRLAQAEARIRLAGNTKPSMRQCKWFGFDDSAVPAKTQPKLGGPWSRGVDSNKTDLYARTKILLPDVDRAILLERQKAGLAIAKDKANVGKATSTVESTAGSDAASGNELTDSESTTDSEPPDDGKSSQAESDQPKDFEANSDEDNDKNVGEEIANEADKQDLGNERNDADEEFVDGDENTDQNADGIDDEEYANEDDEYEEQYRAYRSEVLLTVGGDPYAAKISRGMWSGSKIIVLADGSTTLNLPLVNHQHRILSSKLIDEVPNSQSVIFLESKSSLIISDSDVSPPILFRAFAVAPSNIILLHLTLLGIIFCFSVFPIFGRPRKLAEETASDFGKHVSAVGDLLEKSGGHEHARASLRHYQETIGSKQKR